jgi:hypothetical protein
MKIYRGNTELVDVFLKGGSQVVEELMGDHYVQLVFDLKTPVAFELHDYIQFDGNTYEVRGQESVKKTETALGHNYTVTLFASEYRMNDVSFFLFGQPEYIKNHDYYNGTASQWAALIVENMNRVDSGWSVGSVIESEAINMSFLDKQCTDVLSDIASELNTEYWITGKTIHIGKRHYDSNGLTLSQGEGQGLKEISIEKADDSPPVTRLYVRGGDTNILLSDYGHSYVTLPGGKTYVERNVEKYGLIERSRQYPEIYPKGEFRVSAKIDDYTLQASDIDFNLTDYLIGGDVEVDVIVTFQGTSGLAGYDLKIIKGSWNNATKQFRLEKHKEEDDLDVPGDIHFAVGDMFILSEIRYPQSYKTAAENKLKEKAEADLAELCEKKVQLSCKCDDYLFKKNNVHITPGQMVHVVHKRGQIDIDREIRCTKTVREIDNHVDRSTGLIVTPRPYRYQITLSDFLRGNGTADLVREIKGVPQEIARKVNPVKEYTKRTWRDVMETMAMMFDPDGDYFTDIIKPLVVHTAQLIVGTQSQQFDLVGVRFIPNYNNSAKELRSTAGQLVHFTIDPDNTRLWDIAASSIGNLDDALPYYVYAKCEREGEDGEILVTTQKIKMQDDPLYYHFWVGVLNVPEDGVRSWQPMHGYTEIAGDQITTGVIKDKLAKLIVDLVNAKIIAQNGAEIIGKITFTAGSSGLENVSGWSEALGDINAAKESASKANAAVASLNTYVDGAFADGIVSEAEAAAIQKYINIINSEKDAFIATYNALYTNTNLPSGTAKTSLLNKKITLEGAISNLLSAINSAIADGVATSAERTNVDSKYTSYKSAMSSFNTAIQDAEKAIQDSLKSAAAAAASTASGALTAAEAASNAANAAKTSASNAQTTANSAQTTANDKAKVFYATSAPTSGMKTNDLWVNGTLIYRYSGSSWVNADKYDVQMTIVNGGLISAGAIIFGQTGGMAATGGVRIWSGGTNNSTTNGTFRVTDTGAAYVKNGFYVENPNGTVDAGMNSSGTTETSIRLWAGSTSSTSANFTVSSFGGVFCQYIDVGGVTTGPYIKINGSTVPISVSTPLLTIHGNSISRYFQFLARRYSSETINRIVPEWKEPWWSHYESGTYSYVVWNQSTGRMAVTRGSVPSSAL